MTEGSAGILARDVTVTYRNGLTALSHASFEIPRGTVTALVGVNGAGPCAFRQAEMEAALAANWSVEAVAGVKQAPDDLNSDIHGSAEYRANLVTVMAKRAVAKANAC